LESLKPSESSVEPQPVLYHPSCYVKAASYDDVMMEQLEFLLLHARHGRHVSCPDCTRLDRIGGILLAPFMS